MTDLDVAAHAPERAALSLRHRAISLATRTPGWVRWVGLGLLFLVLSTALVGRFVLTHPALSRADEYVYIDAVEKATHGQITRQGDLIDEYSLELIACRGLELLGPQGDHCGPPHDISVFPYRGGVTSADIHSPAYYFGTAWLAQMIQRVAGVEDLLIAARLTGALWLAAGLTAIVWLARTLGASRLAAGAVAALVIAAPSVRWTNAYITPDGLNLLAGSLIALSAIKYARREWAGWPLIVISALATAVKAPNLIGVALAALFLVLFAATTRQGRTWARFWRFLGTGVAAVSAALVVQATYNVLRARWAIAPAPELGETPLGWTQALRHTGQALLGTYLGPDFTYLPALGVHEPSATGQLGAIVLASGLLAAAFVATHLEPLQQRFAQTTVVAYVSALAVMYVIIWVVTARAFALPDRYAQVLLPSMAASAALALHKRAVAWGAMALGAVCYVYALVTTALV